MLAEFSAWIGDIALPVYATGIAMGLLLAAAWHDFCRRIIPDTISIFLAVFGIMFRLQVGVIDFAFSAIVALLLFFLLFAAFNRGVVGGGDVKLMVATGLWLSPPDCYVFLVVTALAGGVLAVLHLSLRAVLRRMAPSRECAGVNWPVGPLAFDAGVKTPRFASSGVVPSGVVPSGVVPSGAVPSGAASSGAAAFADGVLKTELERIRSGCPLPYGIAIAVGGCYALLNSLGG